LRCCVDPTFSLPITSAFAMSGDFTLSSSGRFWKTVAAAVCGLSSFLFVDAACAQACQKSTECPGAMVCDGGQCRAAGAARPAPSPAPSTTSVAPPPGQLSPTPPAPSSTPSTPPPGQLSPSSESETQAPPE